MVKEELDALVCFIDIGIDRFVFELLVLFISVSLDQLTFFIGEDDIAGRGILIVVFRFKVSCQSGRFNIGELTGVLMQGSRSSHIGEQRSQQQHHQSDRLCRSYFLIGF